MFIYTVNYQPFNQIADRQIWHVLKAGLGKEVNEEILKSLGRR